MMDDSGVSIAMVERETRLSKDVLRAWEKRYGFPAPGRDANGERSYPAEQVERLRLMKRLVDGGLRPGRLARLTAAQLAQLGARPAPGAALPGAHDSAHDGAAIASLLAALKHDPPGFQQALRRQLAQQGLARFVAHTVAPLTLAVGARWEDGSFEIFDEHFYTEETARILRQAIGALPAPMPGPRILLTSLAGETHALGLLMVEALLALDGAACVSLGTDTPASCVVRAAAAHRADIVALSFSSAYPRRQIAPALLQLRQALPAATALWAGGAVTAVLDPIDGVCLLPGLDDGRQALAAWRAVG
jgi:DNA-binding transcriptional MerR regulator/methylmalonyl-CoA mutase cobalamin-binding subunit